MINLFLLTSAVLAGGPAASVARSGNGPPRKRDAAAESYLTITSFPDGSNGKHYCLKYNGASMVTLRPCHHPIMDDANFLFTVTPVTNGAYGQYVMKSILREDLCKLFYVNPDN